MRIRIHPTLYAYLMMMVLLASWETCVGAIVALFVHELGHCLTSILMKERFERLELTPFGGVMIYESGKSPIKGIRGVVIALAGPAANYLLLASTGLQTPFFDTDLVRAVAASNAAMLMINLLPALPLDGGRVIFCIGYYYLPVSSLIRVLSLAGILVGVGLIVLSIYGLKVLGILNCSVVIVGSYLIYSAWACRRHMMIENLYAVIQESDLQMKRIQKQIAYRVPMDTSLIQLLPYFSSQTACEFVVSINGYEYRISENGLYSYLLEQPLMAIGNIFIQNDDG